MKWKHSFVVLVAFLIAADAPPRDDATKAVEQALRTLNKAFLQNDVDTIKKLTGDDLIVVSSSGQRQTKEEQLKVLADLKFSEYKMENIQIALPAKDTAIVTFQAAVRGTFKGKELPQHSAVVTVWIHRGDQWLEVFYQATPLGKK